MTASARPFVLLALLSGAGLLAGGLVLLWQGLRDAQELAAAQGRSAARGHAERIAERLRSPGLMARVPRAHRFTVADGALVVPDWVGWTGLAPRAEDLRATLRPQVALEVEAIERLKPGSVPDQELAERWDRLLADPMVTPAQRQWLALGAGWHALAAGASQRLDPLLGMVAEPVSDAPRSVESGALLLHASAQRPLPRWARDRVRRLPEAEGRALLARLGELGVAPEIVEELAAAHQETLVQRATLRTASRLLLLLAPGRIHLGEADGRIAVFHPGAEVGDPPPGEGFLLPPDAARELLQAGASGLDAEARLVSGPAVRDDADLVPVRGLTLLAVLASAIAPGGWPGPWLLGGLLGVLALCLALGLFLSLRALGREASAVRTRSEFLTSVTHELKTPLAAIRLLAEMLEEGRVPSAEKIHDYHALLAAEAGRLTALVENVLDLGRMDRGERGYDLREQRIAPAVADTLARFEPLARREGMRVEVTLGDQARTSLFDRGALTQALLNVLENSLRYAAKGGAILVRGRAQDGRYELQVEDRGPGIPAAERERVFERFVRGQAQQGGASGGIGLGLYLARAILRAHGGDLVAADPGGEPGARFVFTLPLVEPGRAGGRMEAT